MLGIVGRLRDDAAKCADASLWALPEADLVAAVEQVHRLEQTIAAVKLHLIAEIDARDVAGDQLFRDTAAWLRSRLLLDPAAARQLVDQAAALRRHKAVDAALRAGDVHLRQAAAITAALDALPTTTELAALPGTSADSSVWAIDAPGRPGTDEGHDDPVAAFSSTEPVGGGGCAATKAGGGSAAAEVGGGGGTATDGAVADLVAAGDIAAAAEAALLNFAADFAPAPLRRLGARILDHVAPEVADRLDAIALERAERRAWRERGFTLSAPVDGRVRVSGHLTVEDAAIVSAAMDPLSCPGTDADSRNPAQRNADALIEVCRLALRTGELPDSGGEPPQLAVTVAYDPFARALGVGRLDSGDRLSPATMRRLACDAQVLPVVLSGAGQVLDAGRARRLATGSLRRALVVRDRGCTFPGCDRPPRWCDGHHVRPWTRGGRTDLANLVLLCRRHHHLIHDGDWTVRMAADGLPDFFPPPVLGEPNRPRRNSYHRRM